MRDSDKYGDKEEPWLAYSLLTLLFLQYELAVNFGLIPILSNFIVIATAADFIRRFFDIFKLDFVVILADWNFYWQLILVPSIICLTFRLLRGIEKKGVGKNCAAINMIDQLSFGAILSVDLSEVLTNDLPEENIHVNEKFIQLLA